jgi:hypothetical protein
VKTKSCDDKYPAERSGSACAVVTKRQQEVNEQYHQGKKKRERREKEPSTPRNTKLDLTGCANITDTGLANFRFSLLTDLNLSECSGLKSLAGLQFPLLSDLNLSCCSGLTDTSLAHLRCPRLINLEMRVCRGITDAGLAALQLPLLTTLDVLECPAITVPGYIEYAQEKLSYARDKTAGRTLAWSSSLF